METGLSYLWRVLLVLNNMDPKADRTWKRFVGAVVSLLLVGAIVTGVWVKGWFPDFGGVALAADLDTLKEDFTRKQKDLESKTDRLAMVIVRGALKTALIDRCNAQYRENQEALNAANGQLDDLSEQYRVLSQGREPYLPTDCRTVLIAPRPAQ